jgi:hypothetical protein
MLLNEQYESLGDNDANTIHTYLCCSHDCRNALPAAALRLAMRLATQGAGSWEKYQHRAQQLHKN